MRLISNHIYFIFHILYDLRAQSFGRENVSRNQNLGRREKNFGKHSCILISRREDGHYLKTVLVTFVWPKLGKLSLKTDFLGRKMMVNSFIFNLASVIRQSYRKMLICGQC